MTLTAGRHRERRLPSQVSSTSRVSPREPGAAMAVNEHGEVAGGVSGG